ncbi:MAG: acyltransferase family protein [Pseudomonadota bacterium]
MQYRPEIDGLRTVAVLPVVIYHLKIPFGDSVFLQGGFLGVDIFFVISGYLITRIILEEINQTGGFSVSGFYVRRARRILPALILVSLFTLVASYAVMVPSAIERLVYSILAALGFFANFFWNSAMSEYGAADAMFQPMLHTWSLAIEEQFYVVFPLLLLFLKPAARPRRVLTVILALLVISLAVSQWTSVNDKPFSFYSPASRAWELLVGSALAMGTVYFAKGENTPVGWMLWMPKLAIGVLVGSMFVVNLADWSHPGLATVPTVLATAALIWWARPGEMVTNVLSSGPFTFIGKLSYSIYLWHFPVFALGRLSNPENPTALDMVVWLGVTATLSLAGYFFAERPLRYAKSARGFGVPLTIGLVAVLSGVALELKTQTFSRLRGDYLAKQYQSEDYDNRRERFRTYEVMDAINGEVFRDASQPSRAQRAKLLFSQEPGSKILVLGNSHGIDFFNALHIMAEETGDFEVARFGMSSSLTDEKIEMLKAAPNFAAADIVVVATRYREKTVRRLDNLLNVLGAAGKTVLVVGNTAEFDSPGSVPLFDYLVQVKGPGKAHDEIASMAYRYERRSEFEPINARVRAITEEAGIPYLSRRNLICSDERQRCDIATPEGKKVVYDYGHLTLAGAAMMAERMREQDALGPVLGRSGSDP